jgi:tetratricopeptide (TPR) repeat protein
VLPCAWPRRWARGARSLIAAAAAGIALGLPAVAAADDLQVFEQAKTRFEAGQYDEAAARFAAMLVPGNPPCGQGPTDPTARPCRITDPDLIERARALAGASFIALGRVSEAEAHIEQLLLNNPAYVPSPAMFQPEVIDRFTAVRARIREQIEAAAKRKAESERQQRLAAQRAREEERRWIEALRRLAAEERVIETRSRWIAALPFGVGQFHNGDTTMGWAFLVSEALAGATTIATAIVVAGYEGVDVTPGPTPTTPGQERTTVDVGQLNSRIQTATVVNRAAFGVWAALTLAGIVHAQLTFAPDRVTVRRRPVPPPPPSFSAAPTVSVVPGGGVNLGLTGRF